MRLLGVVVSGVCEGGVFASGLCDDGDCADGVLSGLEGVACGAGVLSGDDDGCCACRSGVVDGVFCAWSALPQEIIPIAIARVARNDSVCIFFTNPPGALRLFREILHAPCQQFTRKTLRNDSALKTHDLVLCVDEPWIAISGKIPTDIPETLYREGQLLKPLQDRRRALTARYKENYSRHTLVIGRKKKKSRSRSCSSILIEILRSVSNRANGFKP